MRPFLFGLQVTHFGKPQKWACESECLFPVGAHLGNLDANVHALVARIPFPVNSSGEEPFMVSLQALATMIASHAIPVPLAKMNKYFAG